MRTGNPTLSEKTFEAFERLGPSSGAVMSVNGTMNKLTLMFVLLMATAVPSYHFFSMENRTLLIGALGASLMAFVLALIIAFKQTIAPALAPVYALLEGVFLGVISKFFEVRYPGIVLQAAVLTLGVMAVMLLLYRARVIRATPAFVRGVVICTVAIALVYIVSLIMRFTVGYPMPLLHESTPLGIAVSLFICGVAALNLILDFDLIERGVNFGAPKYMEWYGAFALTVTLVWLYIEMLRLLAKLRR